MNLCFDGFETHLTKPAVQSTGAGMTSGTSDDAKRTLDDLISRALAYSSGRELKELLDFARRFPHYAPYNAMLLHVQNPDIRYAIRAAVWERVYQRRVNPGARPYVVLQIMGPVAFVFDVSDTHSEAEAVAYLVTDRLNLDIGSVAYLAGYLTEKEPVPNYSLDAVLKAAGKIEEMLHGRFRLKKKPA